MALPKDILTPIDVQSGTTDISGIRAKRITSSTPSTAGAKLAGWDATGMLVVADAITGSALVSISDGTNTQVLSGGDTLTVTASNGMVAIVSATDLLTLAVKLSADAGNDITFGTDGGVYLSKDSLLTGATWNDTTNSLVLTFDDGSTVNVPIVDALGTFISDFSISDGTTTDLVANHETLTFTGTNKIKATVSNNQVSYSFDTTGALAGQTVTFDGSTIVWAYPTPNRFTATFTSTTNTPVAFTHGLNTSDPIIQVRNATTGDEVGTLVTRTSATTFSVTASQNISLRVVAL